MDDMSFGGPALRQVQYENSYITAPEGYGPNTKFERHKVYEVLVQMLKQHLEGQQYDPVKSSQISKMLADDLRETVRTCVFPVGLLSLLDGWVTRANDFVSLPVCLHNVAARTSCQETC